MEATRRPRVTAAVQREALGLVNTSAFMTISPVSNQRSPKSEQRGTGAADHVNIDQNEGPTAPVGQRTTSDDLENILYSIDVATLFLDTDLNIRFFTPATQSLFSFDLAISASLS